MQQCKLTSVTDSGDLMQCNPIALTSESCAVGDRPLDHRALLLPPLSLPLSSLDLQDCQIIEKEGLENCIRGFMTRPALAHVISAHILLDRTQSMTPISYQARLGKVISLWVQEKKIAIW